MLQGDVRNLPLTALLQGLISNHNSGILTLESENQVRRIGVSTSGIEFLCDPDGNSTPLTQILTALDILQPEEISNIHSSLGNAAIGDALLRIRLLDTSIVTGPIRILLQEQLLDLFRWQGASYRFEVCSWEKDRLFTGEGVAPSLRFSIPSLLLEVARREDEDQLNTAAGIHLEEIYEPGPDLKTLESVVQKTIAINPIDKKLSRWLQQQVPLREVISSSGTPEPLALESVRALLEQGLLSPLSSDQKRELADRLLAQKRPARAISVLSSLLDQEDDLPALEKLHLLLQQQKAPVNRIAQILLRLAQARKEVGDDVGFRKALRQRVDLIPEDLDALLDLLNSLPPGKSRRETDRLFEKVHNSVSTTTEALRVAKALESRSDGDLIGNLRWIERSARLRIRANDRSGASQLLDALLRDGIRAGKDIKSLSKALLLLQEADVESHEKWQSLLQRNKNAPSLQRWLIATAGCALLLAAFSQSSDIAEQANALPLKNPGNEITTSIVELGKPNPDSKNRNAEELIFLERGLSLALRLRSEGKYLEALQQINSMETKKTPTTTRRTIGKFREEIEIYLLEAQQLFERSKDLESRGSTAEALSLQIELARNYPYSPIVPEIRLLVPIQLSPKGTRVLIDDREGKQKKNANGINCLEVPANKNVFITAEHPGFESQSLWYQPESGAPLTLRLSPIPSAMAEIEDAIEATIPGPNGSIILIGKEAMVLTFSLKHNKVVWQKSLKTYGDLIKGALAYNDSIVVATTNGFILRLDSKNGSVISETKVSTGSGIFRNPPVRIGGKLIFSTSRGMIHALDENSFEKAWNLQTELVRKQPLHASRELLIAVAPDRLSGINPEDGSIIWFQELEQRPTFCTTQGSSLFLTSGSQVDCISTITGKFIWRLSPKPSTAVALIATQDLLVQVCNDGSLVALDPTDGTHRWSIQQQKTEAHFATAGSGFLALRDSKNRIQIYNMRSGQEQWTFDGKSLESSMAIFSNKLVVGSKDGSLLQFDLPRPDRNLLTPKSSS